MTFYISLGKKNHLPDKQKDVCESVGHPKTPVKMLVWIYELELDESAARNSP